MFAGTYRVRVDEKGRLAIPAGFRKQLTEGSYISVGQDNVLTIYLPQICEILGRQPQAPLLAPEHRAFDGVRGAASAAAGGGRDRLHLRRWRPLASAARGRLTRRQAAGDRPRPRGRRQRQERAAASGGRPGELRRPGAAGGGERLR